MLAARIHRFGPPADVVQLETVPDAPAPAGSSVRVRIRAAPINPADLLLIEGRYGIRPDLPMTPGSEAAGVIDAVGSDVQGLAVGDRVILMTGAGNWQQAATVRASQVIRVPDDLPLEQAAMLKATPATADRLLALAQPTDGAWVAYNAGNSAVGIALSRLAREHGLKALAIVRRDGAAEPPRLAGADAVLVDDGGADWAGRVATATGGGMPILGIDAIGGEATNRLAAVLAPGSLVVNYGLLSGQACRIDPHHLVFRSIRLHGFWLATWFTTADRRQVRDLYARLIGCAASLVLPVEARYPLTQISAALEHAARPGRTGKILLTP